MSNFRLYTPVLVIGSGLAGCSAALTLADKGYEVTLITSGPQLKSGNSPLAQGGIVYKAPEGDPKSLINDILVAGHHHNYRKAVQHIANQGPKVIEEMLLDRLKVPFAHGDNLPQDKALGDWHLTMEGGHAAHRILYCADHTGKTIMKSFIDAIEASPNITVLTGRTAVDLLTIHHHAHHSELRYQLTNQCAGAYVFNENLRRVETILADHTVLATGGIGQVYLHSTNNSAAVGSGITMAQRAGARLENMEYVQFHPTSLYHISHHRFLVSEAVRGEGARLVNQQGNAFMHNYDARGDLAPRDIVARSIVEEMLKTGEHCVHLDASRINKDVHARFPTISAQCRAMGIDMAKDPIPVVPAAHYFCGGILTDQRGRTTIDKLYAVGECACTGVHGANRLASTSLLEALVWGRMAGLDIAQRTKPHAALTATQKRLHASIPDWNPLGDARNDDPALVAQDWATIRHTMWNYVGITRTSARLRRAFDDLRDLVRHLHDFYRGTPLSKERIDLFHGCHTAYSITQAALRNKVSKGCHYRKD
ncbi:MAG: L-aspartate oxidase [Pseudomonadota bacterium]